MSAPISLLLACEFSRLMNVALTPAKLRKVRERNLLPDYAGACASHDFVDANMVMALAWAGVHRRDVPMHFPTMNEAWELARRAGFNADEIEVPA